jgi:hypothetical protein
MSNQSTGNINYSLNKKKLISIFTGTSFSFVPFYYILIFICTVFIITIRTKQYYFSDRTRKERMDFKTYQYFFIITESSPFNFLSIHDPDKDKKSEDRFVGLSSDSYLKIIIAYSITFFIILDGLVRNLIYSIYLYIIQANPLNNPYNNPLNVTKLKDNGILSVTQNYFGVISLTLIFLIPFIIPYIIKIMNFDQYDLKKNKWFTYVILFLIFFPFIFSLISKASFYKKLEIFNSLNKYIETKDKQFVDFIKNTFSFRFHDIIIYLFIIVVYSFYIFCYGHNIFGNIINGKTPIIYIFLLFLIIIFIPIVLLFFSLNILFINNYKNIVNTKNIVQHINKKGVNNVYELLVKYNYPCFRK